MLSASHRRDLKVKGYTIIEGAVPDCKAYKKEIFEWMEQSFGQGNAPYSVHSLVRGYRVGHLDTVWNVRLDVKKHFAQLWRTEELLTSVDTIAIGQPPEQGVEEFADPEVNSDGGGGHWLHVDQCAARKGLHAYQGAVYLETADAEDWTFEVLEGSHELLGKFYELDQEKTRKSVLRGLCRMTDEDVKWFTDQGCEKKRVPCPEGGLLLWDSRLVHANARPLRGRPNPDRWRMVVLVCMGPARWSTMKDLRVKRQAYEKMEMTTHWPCDDVATFDSRTPSYGAESRIALMTSLPPSACTPEAMQLCGVSPYPRKRNSVEADFVHRRPLWDFRHRPDMADRLHDRKYPNLFWGQCILLIMVLPFFAWCYRRF